MDYRQEIIRSVEMALIRNGTISAQDVTNTLTLVLDDYEVSRRETGIVPCDDVNARLLKRYSACLLVEGKKKGTVYAYMQTLKKLEDALHITYPEVTTYNIRFFLALMMDRGVSARSAENARANISAFYQWMTTEGIIDKNPCAAVKPIKCPDKEKFPFTTIEIDAMRRSCKNQKERAMIEVLLASGVRVGELCSLTVSDVNLDTKTVHVRDGKGGKDRTTFLNDMAAHHLRMYLIGRKENGPALFYNYRSEPISKGGVQMLMRRLGKDAGVSNVHPHRFRRTFATGLARSGMELQTIQKLLGHTNINTTMEYVVIDTGQTELSYRKYAV